MAPYVEDILKNYTSYESWLLASDIRAGIVDDYQYASEARPKEIPPGWIPDYDNNAVFGLFHEDDESKVENVTLPELGFEFENDDAAWIMACTFMIFTMQTGFGLVESGMCSMKNEVNIMIKNAVDVVTGGIAFWMFGFSIIDGDSEYSNPFFGVGNFFFCPDDNKLGAGEAYLKFFFHVSYVSSSTTIISGALAERCNLHAFMLFSFANVISYSFVAYWVWGNHGWLRQMGVIDIAGSGVVHALGGTSALMAAYLIGPRLGLSCNEDRNAMGNAQNSLVGLFMMWWAFLAFNSGSTFGVTGFKWMLSAKSTVITLVSSFGGGSVGLAICYIFYSGKMKVKYIESCVFASLVAIAASNYIVYLWEAFLIGAISAILTYFTIIKLEKTYLDDPCGAFAVHGVAGIWGMVAAGLFCKVDPHMELARYNGLLRGEFYLFGVQCLASVVIVVWAVITTYVLYKVVDFITPMRMSTVEELLGADYTMHNILRPDLGVEEAVEILSQFHDVALGLDPTGNNLGHMMYLEQNYTKIEDDLINASRVLSHHFGANVSVENVRHFESKHHRSFKDVPRKAEGGAFGRRPLLHFERHPFMSFDEEINYAGDDSLNETNEIA